MYLFLATIDPSLRRGEPICALLPLILAFVHSSCVAAGIRFAINVQRRGSKSGFRTLMASDEESSSDRVSLGLFCGCDLRRCGTNGKRHMLMYTGEPEMAAHLIGNSRGFRQVPQETCKPLHRTYVIDVLRVSGSSEFSELDICSGSWSRC